MNKRKCWVDDCLDTTHEWGMCVGHLKLWNHFVRLPRTYLKNKTDEQRFEHYIVREISEEVRRIFGVKEECWLWGGGLDPSGYGVFNSAWSKVDGGSVRTHLYSLVNVGERCREPGLEADHTCRIRPCANPAHVEQITQKENTLRGIGFSARNARKKRCDNGHLFTPENTFVDENGWRDCRTCNRESNREYTSRPEVKAARRDAYEPKSGVRGKGQYQSSRGECGEGHRLEGDNLIQEKRTRNGVVSYVRRCRICVNAKASKNHAKRTAGSRASDADTASSLTRDDLADLLGIKRSYVKTYVGRQEGFPASIRIGRLAYYNREDVVRWMNGRTEQLD